MEHVTTSFHCRYYVLSGLGDDDPHPEVLDGLLNGVSSWNEIDNNCLDVTVIPTKKSKSLMEWFVFHLIFNLFLVRLKVYHDRLIRRKSCTSAQPNSFGTTKTP